MKNLYLLILLMPILQVSTSLASGRSASFADSFRVQTQLIATLPALSDHMPYPGTGRDEIFFSFNDPATEKVKIKNGFFNVPIKQIRKPGFGKELLRSLCSM